MILCLSIEEGEAWLLGDAEAIFEACPHVNKSHLQSYVPDSLCRTWEVLADLMERGGAAALHAMGYDRAHQVQDRPLQQRVRSIQLGTAPEFQRISFNWNEACI